MNRREFLYASGRAAVSITFTGFGLNEILKSYAQSRERLTWEKCEQYIKQYFVPTSEQSQLSIDALLKSVFEYMSKGYLERDGLIIKIPRKDDKGNVLEGSIYFTQDGLEFRVIKDTELVYVAKTRTDATGLNSLNFWYDPSIHSLKFFTAELPQGWFIHHIDVLGALPKGVEEEARSTLSQLVGILSKYQR